jgi:hypothetical protein
MTNGIQHRRRGTRFRLFPHMPLAEADAVAETVWLSPPPGAITAGPEDDRMYVVDPIGKQRAYGPVAGGGRRSRLYLPPWTGAVEVPVEPGPDGHFDHLEPHMPGFEAAHVYGTVRFVLDVWEDYLGGAVDWHFAEDFDKLEISILRDLNNALMGYGYMEIGYDQTLDGAPRPFTLSFDVMAHEVGHAIIYSLVGVPTPETAEGEYFGFHESAADQVALIAVLHFDSVIERLLSRSHGNLYTFNRLNRFAELTEESQLRIAANDLTLAEFAPGWRSEHRLGQPLTGAVFDILVDVFHEQLLIGGLISPAVEDLADQLEYRAESEGLIQALFDEAYARNPSGFKRALVETRDIMGDLLAGAWSRLSPDFLQFDKVGDAMLDADLAQTGGRFQSQILQNFRWREIGRVQVGPRLGPLGPDSHMDSARTLVPEGQAKGPRPSYWQRRMAARAGG